MKSAAVLLVVAFLNGLAAGTPVKSTAKSARSGNSIFSSPAVFAHWMLITQPPSGSYAADMATAKSMGIDAFAVNYGGQGTDFAQQDAWLGEFYAAAQNAGIKAFLSIDTSITPAMTADHIVNLTQTYASHPAQMRDASGAPLLTSFEHAPPTSFNWGTDVLAKVQPKPNFVGCSMSDAAWNTLTVEKDQGASGSVTWLLPDLSASDMKKLDQDTGSNKNGNTWIATVAPWFFKRLSSDMNWAQAADGAIFVDRWQTFLSMDPAQRPDAVEITTWNDWGESSYIGPKDENTVCPQCYYDQLDHTGFQRIAVPFIKAFKTGASQPVIDQGTEEVFMFYRTQRAQDNGNGAYGPPSNVNSLQDNVYIVGVLEQPATVTLTTGPTTTTFTLPAGVSKTAVPFGIGVQSIQASRNGQAVGQAKKGLEISGSVTQVNDNVVIV